MLQSQQVHTMIFGEDRLKLGPPRRGEQVWAGGGNGKVFPMWQWQEQSKDHS